MTHNRKLDKAKAYFVVASVTIFAFSLTQTALTYNDFDGLKTHSSLSLLIMGGLAILGGGFLEWLIWFANPLYFIGLLLFYRSNKVSSSFSILATILALSFTAWEQILASESGRSGTIESLNAGYWLWTLSLAILTIGTLYYFIGPEKKGGVVERHTA
jgi:hypothetical protein